MSLRRENATFKKGRMVAPSFAFLHRSFFAFMLLGLALFCLTGCEKEGGVDQKFVDAFVELRVIEVSYGADSPTARLARQEKLKELGYTREQYLAETEKLLNNEKQWVDFQKAVVARIDSLMAKKDGPSPSVPKKPQVPARKGGVE